MGACCTKDDGYGKYGENGKEEEMENGNEEDDDLQYGDGVARVRLQGSSSFVSMYTQQGRKGINQDAMTVWEDFTGEKEMVFCGVFDGHGPCGHYIARHVRDNLPLKLSKAINMCQLPEACSELGDDDVNKTNNETHNLFLSSWEANLIDCFKDMDEELRLDSSIDSFCSGATAVTVIKQGDDLIVANLGDSRAVLCTRGNKNQPVPIQLTVDLKPDIASEAERIRKCKGRTFAVDDEPEVCRVWMPEEDWPGLAMARAFGDFCLKDYGLIAVPEVSYRRLTSNDEFVVLATDGVWDVLTNAEVISIVASAGKRSMAAKLLVCKAVKAWKCKYPSSKIDDCAVICLFLKSQPSKDQAGLRNRNDPEFEISHSCRSEGESESVKGKATAESSKEEWNALEGFSRVNSILKLPRLARVFSRQKLNKNLEGVMLVSSKAI